MVNGVGWRGQCIWWHTNTSPPAPSRLWGNHWPRRAKMSAVRTGGQRSCAATFRYPAQRVPSHWQNCQSLFDRNLIDCVQCRQSLGAYRMETKKGILFYGTPGTGRRIRCAISQVRWRGIPGGWPPKVDQLFAAIILGTELASENSPIATFPTCSTPTDARPLP